MIEKLNIKMTNPILQINEWLDKEKELGSPSPDRVILATSTKDGVPHSRVVAIREITDQGLLFFTQRGTKKVKELQANPQASMTLWLPLQQREVILDGNVIALSHDENENYWKLLPRESQLRFSAYAPTSAQPIHSVEQINNCYRDLSKCFVDKEIPMSEFYCGFRLLPETLYFYTLGKENFSHVIRVTCSNNQWYEQLLSP